MLTAIAFFFGKCATEVWYKTDFWERLWNILALSASVIGLTFNIYWERKKWKETQKENEKFRFSDFLKEEIALVEERRKSVPTEYFKDYIECLKSDLKAGQLTIEISEENKDFMDDKYAGNTQHLWLEECVLTLFEKIFEKKMLSLEEKKIYGYSVLRMCDFHERAYYLYFAWSWRALPSLEKSRYALLIPFFNEEDAQRVLNEDIYTIIRDGSFLEESSKEIEKFEEKMSSFMKDIKKCYGHELGEFTKK